MPSIEVASLYQEAVLWPLIGYNLYGEPVVGDPVQIPVRWENKRTMWTDPKGDSVILDATVFVAESVPVLSRMWLGSIEDWVGTAFVGTGTAVDDEIMQVLSCDSIPDIKGRIVGRVLGLMRLRATETGQG